MNIHYLFMQRGGLNKMSEEWYELMAEVEEMESQYSVYDYWRDGDQ